MWWVLEGWPTVCVRLWSWLEPIRVEAINVLKDVCVVDIVDGIIHYKVKRR